MFKNLNKDNRGFTIIEVLIVLAIAGLIMLIVFLAIPALQRNQRNTTRNNEASRISTAVTECLNNRNGQVASCSGTNAGNVQVGDLQQFSSVTYQASGDNTFAGTTTVPIVRFNKECTTDGSGIQNSTTGGRTFVVMYQLETNVNRCISS